MTERELDSFAGPIGVINDVFISRDGRLRSEMTYDEADSEIKTELMILENNQQLLAKCCKKAWEKLSVLSEVRIKVKMELEDKLEALRVDRTQRELDSKSIVISHKPEATRTPKK